MKRSNRVFVISDSEDIFQKISHIAGKKDAIDFVFLRSYYSAAKIINQRKYESASKYIDIIIVDTNVADFFESIIVNKFSNIVKNNVILGIIRGDFDLKNYSENDIFLYDIINSDSNEQELEIRLHAALSYSKMIKERFFFESMMVKMVPAVVVVDVNDRIQWLNLEMSNLTGYNEEEILGQKIDHFIKSLNRSKLKQNNIKNQIIQLARKDKQKTWVNCSISISIFSEGTFYLYSFISLNEYKLKYDELRLSSKVFEFSGEGIAITDINDAILSVNESFTNMIGYELNEVVGKSPRFLNADQKNSFYEEVWSVIEQKGHWTGEMSIRVKDGTIVPMWVAISSVNNSNNDIDHYITIFSDITDRLADEKHLRYFAQHDYLTGLPNRFLFRDRFVQASANASRQGEKIAILFFDLNKFKEINDKEGHAIGDEILKYFSERLLSQLRSTDTVCRWGGDEFVILLTGILNKEEALSKIQKINTIIEMPLKINDKEYFISASIGVSYFPDDGIELNKILASADRNMYAEKKNT